MLLEDLFAANEVFETLQVFLLKKNKFRTELTVVLAENSNIATSAVVEKTWGLITTAMAHGDSTASTDDRGIG